MCILWLLLTHISTVDILLIYFMFHAVVIAYFYDDDDFSRIFILTFLPFRKLRNTRFLFIIASHDDVKFINPSRNMAHIVLSQFLDRIPDFLTMNLFLGFLSFLFRLWNELKALWCHYSKFFNQRGEKNNF